ncbi:type III secretion system inner rod subunit SctI [Chromobacterium sp. IIBBL 290-4]|uniref:type III secretion system inner rod subunit SctI n=1 Tax=Chromobacterium sp. IIBBL 290-4 TaxID=2953890 RepID=UPI0020B741B3|nr:type III secretion system inner rod subunit SctI [Chromobacterium sp. IIBBL 290-4]UTH74116.1 type III secretion system inner rod subunit SctI [Chromobacterium sp. IIBBL 290-4]
MFPVSGAAATQTRDISASLHQPVSLEDRLVRAFAESASASDVEKEQIMQKVEQAKSLADPAALYQLQLRTSNYNLEVSMLSTLARKGVAVVESLLRA